MSTLIQDEADIATALSEAVQRILDESAAQAPTEPAVVTDSTIPKLGTVVDGVVKSSYDLTIDAIVSELRCTPRQARHTLVWIDALCKRMQKRGVGKSRWMPAWRQLSRNYWRFARMFPHQGEGETSQAGRFVERHLLDGLTISHWEQRGNCGTALMSMLVAQ